MKKWHAERMCVQQQANNRRVDWNTAGVPAQPMACALGGSLAFALGGSMAFALGGSMAFALGGSMAFALAGSIAVRRLYHRGVLYSRCTRLG